MVTLLASGYRSPYYAKMDYPDWWSWRACIHKSTLAKNNSFFYAKEKIQSLIFVHTGKTVAKKCSQFSKGFLLLRKSHNKLFKLKISTIFWIISFTCFHINILSTYWIFCSDQQSDWNHSQILIVFCKQKIILDRVKIFFDFFGSHSDWH